MKKRMRNDFFKVRFAILIALLIGVLLYFAVFQGSLGNRSYIVGDKVCGSYSELEERNSCCMQIHRDDATIVCVGEWKFDENSGFCKYACADSEDELQINACEDSGGIWREFNNGCVDSCELERNPEVILCSQAITYGCDCGADSCWNGEACEDN